MINRENSDYALSRFDSLVIDEYADCHYQSKQREAIADEI